MSPKTVAAPVAAEPIQNPTASESELVQNFRAARRVSTPLVMIETPDAAAVVDGLREVLGPKQPLLGWDCTRGLFGMNDYGKSAVASLRVNGNQIDLAVTVNCAETLLAAMSLPERAVLFMYNLHLQLRDASGNSNPPVVQGLWNLRDVFKTNQRLVVGLAPAFKMPSELSGDVVVFDDPLPTRDQLSKTLDRQHQNAGLDLAKFLPDETRAAALDAMVGLSAFTAEQVAVMSLTKAGINIGRLWERKIKAIENTEGLRVWRPKPTETSMDELKGLDNVVYFMDRMIEADAFSAIVFIDEMDKAFAGGMSDHTGDSGVSKDQVGTLLSYIEDTGSLGVMLAGVAGTGKSQLAKATGRKAKKPVIVFDLGGMKGGIVGKSEEQIRNALKVVTATAEGRVLFIGTANKTTLFTPELNRRFPDQFFYDVPSAEMRATIWPVYVAKNKLRKDQAQFPDGFDRGWTGAEIKRACERAALFGISVVEAARFIIPSSVSGAEAINALRNQAKGRFLSASYPGFYELPTEDETVPVTVNRHIDTVQ